jgi:hypothetical protein
MRIADPLSPKTPAPRYLESEWCRQEMATFVELVGGGTASDRVFLVEVLPTERDRWHPGIRFITPVTFWSSSLDKPAPKPLGWPVPKPQADEAYWDKINGLAHIIALQTHALPPKSAPESSGPPSKTAIPPEAHRPFAATPQIADAAPSSPAAKTLWLADPADDVLEQWESLAAALQEQGHRVLPQAPGEYPYQDEALYRQALNADLAQAELLVQLLGRLAGKKPAWANSRFLQLQAAAAKAEAQSRKLDFFAWREPGIPLDSIADPAHRALLEQAAACEFAPFCQQILDRLARPLAPPPMAKPLSVVVNADSPDRDLGRQAQEILDELEVDSTLMAEPLPTQAPALYRQHLTSLLEDEDCQGVLIVYGAAPPSWVQYQHSLARKVLAMRHQGVWGALLDGPPQAKPEHGLNSRNLMVLECRLGIGKEPLQRFVETLRREAGHV